MKRILILNINFPPSTTIGTQRIIRIAKYLDPLRWDLFALTLKEKYYKQPSQAPAIPVSITEVYRSGKLDPLQYVVQLKNRLLGSGKSHKPGVPNTSTATPKPEPKPAKVSLLKKLQNKLVGWYEFPDKDIAWLPLGLIKGLYVIFRHDIDIIYSSSPSHSQHLLATCLKKLTGRRLVLDFRDPWGRSPWLDDERNASKAARRQAARIQRLEAWVIKHADQVVFVTRQMQEDFIAYYKDQPKEKFHLFYNGYDPDNLALPEHLAASPAKNDDEPFVLVHTGTLYKRRDPTPIILAMKQLADSGRIKKGQLEFHFIGTITRELRHVPSLVEELGVEDYVRFLPPVSYQESYKIMSRSEVLVLLQPITKLQIPGKFFDYICFEKPLLAVCEPGSAVEELVDAKFGPVADINSIDAIARAIMRCFEEPFTSEKLRQERERYDMSKSIRVFDDILDKALISST